MTRREEGPNQIIPTDDLITWKQNGVVKLRYTDTPAGQREPLSLVTYATKQCEAAGDHIAMTVRRGEGEAGLVTWTYKQYLADIRRAAKAFIKLGLEQHNGVAVWGFNSPEWFISDVGAIFAGGVVAGLYPTNSNSVNKFILQDCRANILVVEEEKGVDKILAMKNELPDLKKIVQFTGEPAPHPDVMSWKDLMKLGDDQDDSILEERQKKMAINHCATLIYTSGTTGMPKGVMLSHDNIYWTAIAAIEFIKLEDFAERTVSFLPLSHIAANMVDIWAPIASKSQVFFADKQALRGTLLNTLREARPTIFLGVPRVWEKFMEGMLDKGKNAKGLQKKIAAAVKKAGLEHHLEGKNGFIYNLGKKVVYKKVQEALGLDKCTRFFTGAAPMTMETLKYFLSLDIVIHELYGLSETNGPQTMSFYGTFKPGKCGKTLPGVKSRLHNMDEKGEGEVCMWGRNVMMGYLNREDKTTEDIDAEGWFHSGDLGHFDEDGFLQITGRIKEIIVTAGGENVSPVPVEEAIKEKLPCISNVILIGDKRKFISCILTFRVTIDQETETPTNKLLPVAVEWCKSIGSDAKTVDDILTKPDAKVLAAIQDAIDLANAQSVSNASRVQRWMILPQDVTVSGGELGPTLKLKRFYFNKKYEQAIDKLYN